VQVEPLDLELDPSQDAVLAGLSSIPAFDQEPCGVWSAEGLTVVGMGMRAGLHMTVETRLVIEQAARMLYLVADPISEACILKLNPAAQSLGHMYQTGKRLEVLAGYLMKFYKPEHEVFLYHAPELPASRPLIERVALRDLPRAEFISISTLYIPPRGQPQTNEENILPLERMEVRK
jgi:hypothetical protein